MSFNNVYCDMDGVLADFITPACEFFKLKHPKASPEDQKIFNDTWEGPNGWPRLKKEWPTFWADLDLMPRALDLWQIIQPFAPSLLSAIPREWESAGVGKSIWAKRHLPNFGRQPGQEVIAGPRSIKKGYAQSDGKPNLLIDDFDINITEWTEHGGIGVLYEPTDRVLNNIKYIMVNNLKEKMGA